MARSKAKGKGKTSAIAIATVSHLTASRKSGKIKMRASCLKKPFVSSWRFAQHKQRFPPNHHHLTSKLKGFSSGSNVEVEEQGDVADYPNLLRFIKDRVREYPILTEVSFEDVTKLLGSSTMENYEKELKSINRALTKLKMKETKFKARVMAKILAKLDEA